MRRVILSKLNSTQHRRIEDLIDLCCQNDPIRLSVPLPHPGTELQDERFFALYDQGILVSTIHLFYPDHTVGELIGFTHPGCRRQGHFRRLLDLAADYADEIGLEQVYLITDGNSGDALLALNRLGLEEEYVEFMLEKNLAGPANCWLPPHTDHPSSDTLTVFEASSSPLAAGLFSEIFQTDLEQCDSYLKEISSEERIHTYTLTQNGNPIGQTQLTFMGDMAYISGFGILPEYRGRGYGLNFLKRLERLMTSRSVTRLTLQVSDQNKAALSLYRKDGFETLEALHYYPLFAEE